MNRPTTPPIPQKTDTPVQQETETRPVPVRRKPWDRARALGKFQKILFWSWNWIFALFIGFGLLPFLAPSIVMGFIDGEVNFDLFLFFVTLTLVTPAAAFTGYVKFRRNPEMLFRILYGVEVPLLVLTFFRIVFVRELTPGTGHLLSVFALGSIAYFLFLLTAQKESGKPAANVRLSGATLFFWCALWVFGFLAFLAPILGWNLLAETGGLIAGIPSFFIELTRCTDCDPFTMFPSLLFGTFLLLVGAIFFGYCSTLFIALPFVYVYLGYAVFKTTFAEHWKRGRRCVTLAVTFAVLAGNTALFVAINQQGHAHTLERLERFDGSEAARLDLLADSGDLRQELTRIYLSPYRYLGDKNRSNHLQTLYRKSFNLKPETTQPLQDFFNAMALPLLYVGSGNGMAADQQEAARLYEWFFDVPIQEGERAAIRHALKATYSRDQREAGLINIDNRKVYLETQTVNRVEQGDWAEIEIHEVYVNQGPAQEEVFYHFAMPENSVVTGVWLGENESDRFRFQVASRGAAQRVYKQIQQQRQDPALLEQVGPNLYRLRVFPVPGNRFTARDGLKTRKMHLWWTFKVMRGEGGWPMPRLIEKRNVYWDSETQSNLERFDSTEVAWLPDVLEYKAAQPTGILRAVVADGVEIHAAPRVDAELPARSFGRFALVLETSYSMGQLRGTLPSIQERLTSDSRLKGYDWDYYRLGLHDVEVNSLDALFSQDVSYFGSIDAAEILTRFELMRKGRQYDGVIVLTDRSSFKEKERKGNLKMGETPVFFFLVDGKFPRVTGDGLMRGLIASGGGLETDWNRLANKINFPLTDEVIAFDSHYVWTLHKTRGKPGAESGFTDLAVQKYIEHRMRRSGTEAADILPLHRLAGAHEIVTPYSSMIVLVNLAQKNMLKEAEKNPDRFQRDMENGEELLSAPHKPFEASAVPEPEEWALIGIVLTLLLHRLYRNRENAGFQRAAF